MRHQGLANLNREIKELKLKYVTECTGLSMLPKSCQRLGSALDSVSFLLSFGLYSGINIHVSRIIKLFGIYFQLNCRTAVLFADAADAWRKNKNGITLTMKIPAGILFLSWMYLNIE